MRVKLKSSKSYPNDLLRQDATTPPTNGTGNRIELIEEGDNSSSGVSSDQEITVNGPLDKKPISDLRKPSSLPIQETPKAQISIKTTAPAITAITAVPKVFAEPSIEQRSDDDDSPSPPAKGFQRHNSLTRKQAATIAMNRAIQSRVAVSLVKLPPPIEADIEGDNSAVAALNSTSKISTVGRQQTTTASENIVLAPPPQFCDCVNASGMPIVAGNDQATTVTTNNSSRGVRIVGALPKVNKMLGH